MMVFDLFLCPPPSESVFAFSLHDSSPIIVRSIASLLSSIIRILPHYVSLSTTNHSKRDQEEAGTMWLH